MLSEPSLELINLVAQLGSFTAAANHLNKVPSAVSYAVKQIEDEINVVLFERHHRSVSLTPAGQHFVKEARLLLNAMAELKQSTVNVAQGWQPKLSLALDSIVRADRLAYLIRDFYQQFSDTELVIRKENFNGVWESLSSGRCDVALGASASLPVGGPFAARHMGKMQWCLVMSPRHPLAGHHEPLTPATLIQYPAVTLSDTSWQQVGHNFTALPLQRRIQVPDWIQAFNLLHAGLGVGWVPRHLVQGFIASKSLCEKTVSQPLPDNNCALLWNTRRQSPALQWLLAYLGDEAQLRHQWIN
ncbi:DNA-binding transcriptional activator PunR [Shewanella sp. YIC-542]|uniref:DNA-binding transcriptional activator PunR n=1 Tax=Shewanella mytili TaxID=3377111 RepID=UPI00398E97D3